VKPPERSARTISRRDALRLLSAAGLAPLVAGTGVFGGCGGEQRGRLEALAPLWNDPALEPHMARIGRLWLDAQTPVPGTGELLQTLGWPGREEASLSDLRRWLWQRQRDDWLVGRVYAVNEFRLAHTEVRLYALAELLRQPDAVAR
jgi:hypothetical protein